MSKGRDGYIGVGLSTMGVNMNRLPGWDKNSCGYHGDDGHRFRSSGTGQEYGPTFTTGDVIGCGINLVDGSCFFTKNGHHLGVAFKDLPSQLYPTVGLQTPGEVIDANFGQEPFKFDVEGEMRELRRKTHGVIEELAWPRGHKDAQSVLHTPPPEQHQPISWPRMNDANTKESWKRLFFLLFNNKEPDDQLPLMWAQFKRKQLNRSDLEAAIQSFKDQLEDNVIEELDTLLSDKATSVASLLEMMGRCSLLGDDFWCLLFTAIRDRESHPIGDDKTVPILEGGQTKLMTMKEIEELFFTENQNILRSSTCVPDQMIHEDLIDAHLNTNSIEELLRKSYESTLAETMESIAQDNPNLKEGEVEKQAAGQAKKEVKQSRDAKLLQHRVAMKAEEKVQKSIQKAMGKFKIPVYVFRGVNTFDDLGQFLRSLGMKMSKLKAFKPGGSDQKTFECEHDIGAVALLPSGPLVSFVQV